MGDSTTNGIMKCNFAKAKEGRFRILFSSDGTKATTLKAVGQKYEEPESREPRVRSSCTLHKHGKLRDGELGVTEPVHPNQITGDKSHSFDRHDLR